MSILRRMTDDQLPAVLALLAESGGTARTVESWRQDRMTALVLGDRSGVAMSAVMPMSQRELAVSPGRRVSVGWLSSNQLASRMSLRRQTRETFPEWPELLSNLDALVVTRRDEASLAARWYAQTGFHEVLSSRCLYLDMEAAPGNGAGAATGRYQVRVANASDPGGWDADRWQPQMLAVYQDVYGGYGGAGYGGAVVRKEGFWSPALAHHYYGRHYQFQIVGLWSGAESAGEGGQTLMGYAVVGWSGWHSKRPRMDILELATRQWDTGVASELLRTTCQLAWSKKVHQVRAVISAHDPYRGHLSRSGFVDRWGYVMLAKWLHPQRYLDRLGQQLAGEAGDLSLRLTATGEVPLSLRTGKGTARPITLEGDSRTLTRLLLNRLDIGAALMGSDGNLFMPEAAGAGGGMEQTRLSLAFPWTPWAFHMLDYI